MPEDEQISSVFSKINQIQAIVHRNMLSKIQKKDSRSDDYQTLRKY